MLTQCLFFGQALNNTSERNEVSLLIRFRDSSCRQNDKFACCIDVGSTVILPKKIR